MAWKRDLKMPNRQVSGILIAVALAATSCESANQSGEGRSAEASVKELAGRLEEAGLGCEDVLIKRSAVDASEAERYAPVAEAYGHCVLTGSSGEGESSLGSRILVFPDEEHLEAIPPSKYVIAEALVYESKWRIYVVPPSLGKNVAEALDGKLILPE